MSTITIAQPHLLTKLEIWQPRYSDKYTDKNERVALIAKYKVEHATGVVLVEFTKAKHLEGQRFAIKRDDIMRCTLDSNGKVPCYAVPMSLFSNWQTTQEVVEIANNVFED